MTGHHDPGSGVDLVPCDCGNDCEWVETECCDELRRECETYTSEIWIAGELEDRFRFCADGFGCEPEKAETALRRELEGLG